MKGYYHPLSIFTEKSWVLLLHICRWYKINDIGNSIQIIEKEIVRNIKESVCYVAFDPSKEEELIESEKTGTPASSKYKLPDGSIIEVGPERFRAPEVLFHPELIGEVIFVASTCIELIRIQRNALVFTSAWLIQSPELTWTWEKLFMKISYWQVVQPSFQVNKYMQNYIKNVNNNIFLRIWRSTTTWSKTSRTKRYQNKDFSASRYLPI
jgi:hypothetical protein